ncbi:unnamed protein product [Vicia faba]|uniref:Protein TIC 214 n=1 Tax=Vicia faba TaxID=3906 RepID=A0AAV0YAN9_VICFA|nr:unnamed protein product [Vicia faba]
MDASPKESQIRSPKADRIVLFNSKTDSNDNQNSAEPDRNTEFAVVHYSREPDYCRDLIRGSMRPQRRKTVTYKLFQGTAHSPLFLEIMGDYAFLFGDLVYDISQYLKEYFRKPGTDNSEFLAFEKTIEQKEIEENKDESEIRLRQIEEAWESILYEDLRDWRKEVHIYCTYQGVPVSHTALPTNWFWEGIQIRILFPFVLKPWHNKFYGNKNITDVAKLKLEKKEYGKQADLKSYLSNYYRDTRYSITRYRKDLNGEQNFLLDKYFGFYLHCKTPVQETLMDNINLYCLLVRLKNLKQFFIMSIKKADLDFEITARLQMKDTCYTECRDTEELRDNLMFFIEPIRISRKNYEQFFIYQTISISLRHKRKILKRNYDLLVPENLLSTRRRRELRILICLNPQNRNTVHRNTINDTEKKRNNSSEVLTQNEDIDSDTKKLMTLKFFLWPNYRFEDLACMNRYWFDTHNGSRFSILRIHMYPRLKI